MAARSGVGARRPRWSAARSAVLAAFVGFAVSALARSAPALPLQWDFEGAVRYVAPHPPDLGVTAGDPMRVSLRFDPGLAALVGCDEDIRCAYSVPGAMVVRIRDHVLESISPVIQVQLARVGFFEVLLRDAVHGLVFDGERLADDSFALLSITAPPIASPRGLPAASLPVPEVDANLDWVQINFSSGRATLIANVLRASESPEPVTGVSLAIAVLCIAATRSMAGDRLRCGILRADRRATRAARDEERP